MLWDAVAKVPTSRKRRSSHLKDSLSPLAHVSLTPNLLTGKPNAEPSKPSNKQTNKVEAYSEVDSLNPLRRSAVAVFSVHPGGLAKLTVCKE